VGIDMQTTLPPADSGARPDSGRSTTRT
jgi:hypothetical protein